MNPFFLEGCIPTRRIKITVIRATKLRNPGDPAAAYMPDPVLWWRKQYRALYWLSWTDWRYQDSDADLKIVGTAESLNPKFGKGAASNGPYELYETILPEDRDMKLRFELYDDDDTTSDDSMSNGSFDIQVAKTLRASGLDSMDFVYPDDQKFPPLPNNFSSWGKIYFKFAWAPSTEAYKCGSNCWDPRSHNDGLSGMARWNTKPS